MPCNETPELMPAPIMFAHRLGRELTRRCARAARCNWLRPDAKSQVSVVYDDGKPVSIVERGHLHPARRRRRARGDREVLHREDRQEGPPEEHADQATPKYLINPTGRFVVGGPQGDSGLTGRKIIVDTYGGMGRHGGGAFSGKDPSKVDRSAAYMGR